MATSQALPPQLDISLNEKDQLGNIPTYQPGQDISGYIKINSESPIQVLHLRVVFYGHVQIYGEKPGIPLKNGIFDYLKNQQLINTGIRIARRPTLDDISYLPSSSSSSSSKPESSKHYDNEDNMDQSTIYYGTIQQKNNNKKKNKKHTTSSTSISLNKQVDKFIHVIASKENKSGSFIHDTLPTIDHNKDHIYELLNKKYQVKFKIPLLTSKPLPPSFQHPHCPIQYYTIAIMLCKNIESNAYYVSYTKIPLRFEPQVNVLSTIYAGLIRESDRLWLGHDSILNRLFHLSQKYRKNDIPSYPSLSSSSDSSSDSDTESIIEDEKQSQHHQLISSLPHIPLLSDLWYKLLHPQHAWTPLQQHQHQHQYPKTLDCTLELPRRAFCKGQSLPLSIKLFNGVGIRIAMVMIEIKLIRKITMTSNVSEVIHEEVDFESTSIFYGDEVDKVSSKNKKKKNKNPFFENNNQYGDDDEDDDDDNTWASTLTPPLTPLSEINDDNDDMTMMKKQPFFLFNNRYMHFDLSTVALIPQHCPCSIMASLTKDLYEVEYELATCIKILESKNGPKLDASLDEHSHDQMARYYARPRLNHTIPSNDYKVFYLEPPKVNLVIGNVACKS